MLASILSWKNILAGQHKRHIELRKKLEDQQEEIEEQLEKLVEEENKDGYLNWQIGIAESDQLKEFDNDSPMWDSMQCDGTQK